MSNPDEATVDAMTFEQMIDELDSALIDVEHYLNQAYENLDEARRYANKLIK